MKRVSLALSLLLLLSFAAAAFADEETAPAAAAKPSWTENIKVGAFVDVRPVFYWMVPENASARIFHNSDVEIYEAGIRIVAKPADFIQAVVVPYFSQWGNNYHVTQPLGSRDASPLNFNEAWVQVGGKDGPFLRAGKYFMPITDQTSFSMNYTLLQRELLVNPIAIGIGYNYKYVDVSVHAWNGENDLVSKAGRPSNDIIDTYAAALSIFPLAMLERYSMTLSGYFLTDCTETWGDFYKLFNGVNAAGKSTINYDKHVPLYGGYLTTKLGVSDLVGIGLRGEYAATGEFAKHDYALVNASTRMRTATNIQLMNAELALMFWDGVITLGGLYNRVNGMDYFAMLNPDLANVLPYGKNYEVKYYQNYGGFFRTNLMQELSIGVQYTAGADNMKNRDQEVQTQLRVDF